MRVVIGVLADERAVRALVHGWLSAGCPATRLHLFARIGIALDGTTPPDSTSPLVRLARHDSLVLWALETPVHERCRSSRPCRRRRRALTLLGRLAGAGATSDWSAHAGALARGCPLGVARLERADPDPATLVRPLLAHAAAPVRICDLGVPRGRERVAAQWQPLSSRARRR